jgi:hypothetical protein
VNRGIFYLDIKSILGFTRRSLIWNSSWKSPPESWQPCSDATIIWPITKISRSFRGNSSVYYLSVSSVTLEHRWGVLKLQGCKGTGFRLALMEHRHDRFLGGSEFPLIPTSFCSPKQVEMKYLRIIFEAPTVFFERLTKAEVFSKVNVIKLPYNWITN